jgi:catechol 2,3-dioxygenase-like lactoylglutathione lyase family enzyme
MITGIDHLVIAVPDPEAAARELEERVGLLATSGGRHEGMGTFNRITWLADGSYLELLGVEDREAALGWAVGAAVLEALDHGGGLACYALATNELEATVAELQANGSSIGAVQHGSRLRPDGELVEWWSAAPQRIGLDAVPFLIQHAMTGAEWGPDAVAARADIRHPLGAPALLSRLDLAADDPPTAAALYFRELGLEFWAVGDLAVRDVGPHVVRLVRGADMEVPAVITLGASVEAPRSTTAFGLRFDVEPVAAVAVATRA